MLSLAHFRPGQGLLGAAAQGAAGQLGQIDRVHRAVRQHIALGQFVRQADHGPVFLGILQKGAPPRGHRRGLQIENADDVSCIQDIIPAQMPIHRPSSFLQLGQDAAVHPADDPVGVQQSRVVAAGDEGLALPHPGQQVGPPALVQLAEHVVQQQHRPFPGDPGGGVGLGHLQAQHHAALLALAGKAAGRLPVQRKGQVLPVGAAQALPGPHFLVAAGGQARGQAPRLKLGLITDFQPLGPAGKLPVILRRHGGQQAEIRPPAGLDLLAAGGKRKDHAERKHKSKYLFRYVESYL